MFHVEEVRNQVHARPARLDRRSVYRVRRARVFGNPDRTVQDGQQVQTRGDIVHPVESVFLEQDAGQRGAYGPSGAEEQVHQAHPEGSVFYLGTQVLVMCLITTHVTHSN